MSGWSFATGVPASRNALRAQISQAHSVCTNAAHFTMLLGDSNKMFSYLRVVARSNGSTKLQDHCAMCLRKLLIGLVCLPLFAQGGPNLTPAETEARDDGAAKLRALIEASPKLPLEHIDLTITLPKGQELGMVSWLARDAETGVTWLIQRIRS